MTANRRIFLNIVATYGRSLFALLCGLFTARWTLQSLGEVDYGLYGVVGGLTAFIAFFNGLLAGAIGRFYAVSVGKAQAAGKALEGLEECRQWFSIAVFIHTVIPLVLMVIGYPIGVWAVRNWLTIPPDRIEACVWVFRCVCVMCFISMVNVPFSAMYTAKQYIAELTIYSFISTTLNVCFLCYMITHPGEWLTRLAVWTMCLSVVPQIIICLRAIIVFPECRFRFTLVWAPQKFKQLLYYAGWNTFGSLGYVLRAQGIAILVNQYYGPTLNASMGIANSVSGHVQSLTGAMQGAFTPAIANAVGAKDYERVRNLAFRFCKYGLIFLLLFLIPIALELPLIMRLWLKTPPQCVTGLCWLMLLIAFLDKNTLGHGVAIMALGKIKMYQIVCGSFTLLAVPLAWLMAALGANIYWTTSGIVIAWALLVYGRLFFAKRLLGMGVWCWFVKIMCPVWLVLGITVGFGLIPQLLMEDSLSRILLTTCVSEVTFVTLAWLLLLDVIEKKKCLSLFMRFLNGKN